MWQIILYEKEDGTTPVADFLNALPAKHRAKAVWEIELLEQSGTSLGMPHVKHIEDKVWELRIKFASDIARIFYFVPIGETIVLLHGFVKKSQKAPKREIAVAQAFLTDYERRARK